MQSRACYEVAVKNGKSVIVMEPVKGGTLAQVPEEAEKLFKAYDADMSVPSWAIRFAASLEHVMVVLSGMSNIGQIAIPQYFSLYNEDMREHFEEKGWTVNFSDYAILAEKFSGAKDCIGCGQCERVCPHHIPIIENLKEVSAHFDH